MHLNQIHLRVRNLEARSRLVREGISDLCRFSRRVSEGRCSRIEEDYTLASRAVLRPASSGGNHFEQSAKMYPASQWRVSGGMMMIRASLSLLIAPFGMTVGGRVDLWASRYFAIRPVHPEYLMTKFPDGASNEQVSAMALESFGGGASNSLSVTKHNGVMK